MIDKNRPSRRQVIAFVSSQTVLFLVLLPPLSEISSSLFSAHMLQHVVLMLVGAPLFAYSSPQNLLLFALPGRSRERLDHIWSHAHRLRRVFSFASKRWITWMLFGGVLWIWHFPILYELALQNSALHAFEHLCLFGSSALFWWTITRHRSYTRAALGPSLFYVLTTAAHMGILGALFSFASAPVYRVYSLSTPIRGWRALEDQQLAGLIMWIVGASAFVLFACVLFVEWLNAAEDGVRERERQAKLKDYLQATKTVNANSNAVPLDLCKENDFARELPRSASSRDF